MCKKAEGERANSRWLHRHIPPLSCYGCAAAAHT